MADDGRNSEEELSDSDSDEDNEGNESKKADYLTRLKQKLLKDMNEQQHLRYSAFLRSSLKKAHVRKLIASTPGITSSEKACVVVAGVSKVLVFQLIEEARAVMMEESQGDACLNHPVRPRHVREAYNRLLAKGTILPPVNARKHLTPVPKRRRRL